MQPAVKDDLTPSTVSKRATEFVNSPSSPPEAQPPRAALREDSKREDEGPGDPTQKTARLPQFCCIDFGTPAEILTSPDSVKNDGVTIDFTAL